MNMFRKKSVRHFPYLLLIALSLTSCPGPARLTPSAAPGAPGVLPLPAGEVLRRTFGSHHFKNFVLEISRDAPGNDWYSIETRDQKVLIRGNSQTALCRGAYDYLKTYGGAIHSWTGTRVTVPSPHPAVQKRVQSPYTYRYYFNVVTHGYSTAFWDWPRWEKEIDWMAIHGLNTPLIGGAHEVILFRVFKKLGLKDEEIKTYVSGPAFLPWNRMGNLNGWDGPLPDSWFSKQLRLTHQILERMRALDMTPIVHAFAGFVPKTIQRLHPGADIRELSWGGGLPVKYNAWLLSPSDPLFTRIGSLYIREWEAEFGPAEFYLADSFNEMDVPLPDDPDKALRELAQYGTAVYRSIAEANKKAVWVMQGWTFPFHKDKNGARFWTPERLKALISDVPDDKLLILDLANEYNHVFWKIEPSWKLYEGFFGKKWIYSFIPNMGGKTPLNGRLDVYATIPAEALHYEKKGNLAGFGFAPEGIENNEIIYELLSDIAWRHEKIDLNAWIESYCIQRYGAFPDSMRAAFQLLTSSCFGSFTDHPVFRYQLRPYKRPEGVESRATVHRSETFNQAVEAFLGCASELRRNPLYIYDAVELIVQYLGLEADRLLTSFLEDENKENHAEFNEAMEILLFMDRLLASHPNHNLSRWVDFARAWGENDGEKNYYESGAKRLITTWGGDPVNDYSGRVWSGLIRDYYVPRWKARWENAVSQGRNAIREWEERWIQTPGVSHVEPFADPLAEAEAMFFKRRRPSVKIHLQSQSG